MRRGGRRADLCSVDGLFLVLGMAAAAVLPAATEIFGNGRDGTSGLSGLPVRAVSLGLARFAAVLTGVAVAFCVLVPVNAFAHGRTEPSVLSSGRGLQVDGAMIRKMGTFATLGLSTAMLLAFIFRHSVGAVFESCAVCLLYTSPSPRDKRQSRMPSSA